MTTAVPHSFEEIVVEFAWRPSVVRPAPAELSKEQAAARLQLITRKRARDAAEEALFILRFAELCTDAEDPPPDSPGARKTYWRSARSEFAGVSGVHLARQAPGHLRRPQAGGDRRAAGADPRRRPGTHRPGPGRPGGGDRAAGGGELTFTALKRRIAEVLLELDPAGADEGRKLAEKNSDVFLEPAGNGRATLGAELPVEEAAEGYEFLNTLAQQAKIDGDPRPIGQLRNEIFSLLVRGAALSAHGARTNLTITAALEALEGTSSRPADVNGYAITPTQLAELLRRVGALGLTTPADGSLTFAVTDVDGRVIATLSLADLQQAVKRGEGANPPAGTDRYRPTAEQREFVTTRDQACRMPFCGQRTGWADHDHVIAHSAGGKTTCTNLCCLCRSHHRLKTLAKGWLFVMEPDGTLHVTTPSGVTRTTRPWAMRKRPPPEPPPDDPPPF